MPDRRHRLAVGALEHARGVDRHVPLRIAEHLEDRLWGRGDHALDFDAFGHDDDRVSSGVPLDGFLGVCRGVSEIP